MRKFRRKNNKHLGEMRTSQLVTSYGVGAMVDFKDETAILSRADEWFQPTKNPNDKERIIHCHNLERVLGKDFFVRPKWDPKPRTVYQKYYTQDIGAYRFPQMLYCPKCNRLVDGSNLPGLRDGPPKCTECKNTRLVPSRFVVVCARGHLDDFPYYDWVHRGKECPKKEDNKGLKLRNMDGRNSISSLQVFCDNCDASRGMQAALVPGGLKSVCRCRGRRPWLSEEFDPTPCSQEPMVRLRTAAGVYMPVNVSALNIPPMSSRIVQCLQNHMEFLKGFFWDRQDQWILNNIPKEIVQELPGTTPQEIVDAWNQLLTKSEDSRPQNEQQLYEDEYKALCSNADAQDDDFASIEKGTPKKYRKLINRVFAVERLTEVVAMLGFTRLRSWDGDYNSSSLAPIFSAQNQKWLPAVKQKGEGIFIELDEDSVEKWENENKHVYSEMIKNAKSNHFRCDNISPRFVLLHTLSHLLIRALSVNCGYQSSSIKERIYSTYSGGMPMSGILIYTTTSDAEGSLGGLVGQTEHLQEHLDALLDEASWCSSDPLCLTSSGKNAQGLYGMNYGACPQCTLLPETACVMRNSLLDRGALIGRNQDSTVGYFSDNL